ncbi:MAG: EI24 domain-containing protein [Alcaligenes sp.]
MSVSSSAPSRSGPAGNWASVSTAFRRSLVSQFQPRMLIALVMPFLIMFVGLILLSWLLWTPIQNWLLELLGGWNAFESVDQWLVGLGLFSLKVYLAPLLALGILLPVAGVLGLIIAAVLVMPLVLGHLQQKDYPDLIKQGHNATVYSVWNAVWVSALFLVGWLVTLPLWIFPPFALILPVLWWVFALTRILRVDSLVEHANVPERRFLWSRLNSQYWLIGLIFALLNLIPPAWLVLPVFSALVFAHFSLENLRRLRQQEAAAASDLLIDHDN